MTVKIGMVGCGYMGQVAHLDSFHELVDCEIVALAESRAKLREQVADRYRIAQRYDDHRPIAEDTALDGVVAIMNYTVQVEPVCDLLRAGHWVMIEKPMAVSLAESQRLVDAAEEGGGQLMVGFMKRFDPGVRHAQQVAARWFETGEAGALLGARAVVCGGEWQCNIGGTLIETDETARAIHPDEVPFPEWLPKTQAARHHHFLLFDICVHNVNLLRFLIGEPLQTQSVLMSGVGNAAIFEARGVPVTMSWGLMNADTWHEETELLFEQGYIKLYTPPPLLRNVPTKVEIYHRTKGKKGIVTHPQVSWEWSFKEQARHFVECIRTRKTPLTHAKDSIQDIVLLEEILKKHYVQ